VKFMLLIYNDQSLLEALPKQPLQPQVLEPGGEHGDLVALLQHPGEIGGESNDPANPRAHSNWPDYRADGRPRSATVVIQRIDGSAI